MKTCCPSCQTIFRVTSEQIRARAGKVRCGQCRTVFNAIDGLIDDDAPPTPIAPEPAAGATSAEQATDAAAVAAVAIQPWQAPTHHPGFEIDLALPPELALPPVSEPVDVQPDDRLPEPAPSAPEPGLTHAEEPARESLVRPRETLAYGKWLEGVMGRPALPADRAMTKPYAIIALLLAVMLACQGVFHFRVAIALGLPGLRPALAALSDALGADMPLPRHSEWMSIETSELQIDPGHHKLLALQATLRNRAAYVQAYPALELTLTDTHDKVVARRVLQPDEYLPPSGLLDEAFAANADLELRLWLEASGINAAGYRLYVFYP